MGDELEALRESVRRLLGARTDPADRWAALAGIGALGILVPEDLGGGGAGLAAAVVVAEELGRALDPSPWASSSVGAVSAIATAGSAAQRERWLPAIADGTLVATLAADGPAIVMHAAAAQLFIAPDGAVYEAPAVEVEPLDAIDPTRGLGTVRLPPEPSDRLDGDLAEAVDHLRVALVADAVGCAAAAMEAAVDYAKERVQFGVPIGSFQAVQHLCADMLRDVELARAAVDEAVALADARHPDRHRAALLAKAFAGEALPRVSANAMQVFGGVGFTWEHDAHRWHRRLLALDGLLGTSGQHLDELSSLI